MNFTANKLQEIKQYGYPLDFGQVFGQAFENYKKVALIVGSIILVLIMAFTVLVGGLAGIVFGIGSVTEFFTDYSLQSNTTVLLLVNLVASVIGAALISPLTAGLLKITHLAENNKEFTFSTAFDYYKSSYLKDLFLSTIIITLFSAVFSTTLTLIELYFPGSEFNWILKLCSLLIGLFTPLFTFLTIPLIIFGDISAVEAIKGSMLLVRKNFWIIVFLVIVGGIFSLIGIFGFCLGIFFTLPFIYSLEYIIYRNAIDFEEESEIDEIGTSVFLKKN
jgi:uncharacterized membrane protein